MSDLEFTRLFLKLGFTLSAAVILGIMLKSQKPLTFGELVQKSGYAKGHVSLTLKNLEAMKIVERFCENKKTMFKLKERAISNIIKEHLAEIREFLQPVALQFAHKDDELSSILSQLDEILKTK
ncbi:MAG: hypothetical protein QW039_06730 [Fervidicoccaceae archaeon]